MAEDRPLEEMRARLDLEPALGKILKQESLRGCDAHAAKDKQIERAKKALDHLRKHDGEFILLGVGPVDPETGLPHESGKDGEFCFMLEFYTDPTKFMPLALQVLKGLKDQYDTLEEKEKREKEEGGE